MPNLTPAELQALAAKCEADANAGKVPNPDVWEIDIAGFSCLRGPLRSVVQIDDAGDDFTAFRLLDTGRFGDLHGAGYSFSSRIAAQLFAEELLLRAMRPLVEARVMYACKLAPNPERMFPIMDGRSIPWSLIAPFERQAMANHGRQSLERLAERGGLSKAEAYAVVAGSSIRDVVRQLDVTKAAAHWDEWVEARIGLHARIADLEAALEREREDHARTVDEIVCIYERCSRLYHAIEAPSPRYEIGQIEKELDTIIQRIKATRRSGRRAEGGGR